MQIIHQSSLKVNIEIYHTKAKRIFMLILQLFLMYLSSALIIHIIIVMVKQSLKPEGVPEEQQAIIESDAREVILTHTSGGITIQTTSEIPDQIIQQDTPLTERKSPEEIEQLTK